MFASVAQKAIRKVARSVFDHLLRLDLNFHLTRQTGGLTRAIDRGTKGISFLLTSMVFHVFPTALEISMVCGILVCAAPGEDGATLTDQFRRINMVSNLRQSPLQPWLHTLRLLSPPLPGGPNSGSRPTLLTTRVLL